MLELLLGRNVETKSRWMYRQIDRSVDLHPQIKHYILVPEQYTVQAEQSYLEATGKQGLMNPEVISFNRLAHRVFQETGGRTRRVIDELGKHMMVRKILLEREKDLLLFQGLGRESDLVQQMMESITECKQYEITPDLLEKSADLLSGQPLLQRKIKDLSVVYRQFEEGMKGTFVDQEDQFSAMVKQLGNSNFLAHSFFWIDGFFSFTPQMLAVIKTLVKTCRKVALTAYGNAEWLNDEAEPLMLPVRTLLADAKEAGMGVIATDTDPVEMPYDKPKALEHLSSHFLALPVRIFRHNAPELTLFAAANDDSEIEQVAARIQCLVQEKQYRYREIAVLCPDLEQRQDVFKRYFFLQQIPFFLDIRRKKTEQPLAQMIPSLLENILKKFSHQSLFQLLKTGFFNTKPEDLEWLENVAAAAGIKGNLWKTKAPLFESAEESERYETLKNQLIIPVFELESKMKDAANIRDLTEMVHGWLEEMNVIQNLEMEIHQLKLNEDYEAAAAMIQLWNRIIELMDQLVAMMGESSVSLQEYHQIWNTGLQSIEIGMIPPTYDQVVVGTPERSRLHEVRALFLIGMNDGVLPASGNERGLLLMTEKMMLQQQGCRIGVTSEFRQAQEYLMVQLAISRPKEYLWMSYSLADIEGVVRRPSIMIERIKKMIPALLVETDSGLKDQDELAMLRNPHYGFLKLAAKLRDLADGDPVADAWIELFDWFCEQEQWKPHCTALKEALFYQHQPSPIRKDLSEKLFGNRFQGSVSRLEQYNRCPFAHFVRYGLSPVPKQLYEVLPPDVGNVLHQIMDLFGQSLKQSGQEPDHLDEHKMRDLGETVAREVIDSYGNGIFSSSHQLRHLGKSLKRISMRSMDTITYHLSKSSFRPVAYELKFGENENNDQKPLFQINTENGQQISLNGRIDRVDGMHRGNASYYAVIDYKTGKQKFSFLEVKYGLQLQLLAYMMAVLELDLFNEENKSIVEKKPAGVFYFYLDDPMISLAKNDAEAAVKEIRKELKMDGLALRDYAVIKAMDHGIDDESDILPLKMTKTGELQKSSKLLSEDEFKRLQIYLKHLIGKTAGAITNGKIQVEPVQLNGRKPCEHCDFGSICQHDSQFADYRIKKLEKMSEVDARESILRAADQEDSHHETMDQ